jgi:hypothetical protein
MMTLAKARFINPNRVSIPEIGNNRCKSPLIFAST